MFRLALAMLALCAGACAASQTPWTLARSAHFEVYSQSGEDSARAALGWFEQLRAFFFAQTNLDRPARPPVRVIGFRSPLEFRQFTSRAADAYYLGTESRDSIVMCGLTPSQFRVAAHEYAHVMLHGSAELPSWFSEGVADFLSTVRISEKGSSVGGDLSGRSRLLAVQPWMPLQELFSVSSNSPLGEDRKSAGIFYAESWALVHMLVLSPRYNTRLSDLIASLISGSTTADAFSAIYARSPETILDDVHSWISNHATATIALPGVITPPVAVETSSVPPLDSGLLVAELLTDSGELDRAEALYRDLDRTAPGTAAISVGRGVIALRRGDRGRARKEWHRAIEQGINDPIVCYRYAMLAQEASLDAGEIRPALERAIALQPSFDDARYALALLEMNSGNFERTVTQLRAMKTIAPARAYAYWSGLAYALNELDEREPAKAAAFEAGRYAKTPSERARASELAYFAATDLTVRFTRDASGQPQLVTARAPHGQDDWNPFIEPSDRIRRVDATLSEIVCDAKGTRIVLTTPRDRLTLLIADPSRVQMRHAPPEFTCGPQSPRSVSVEYAAAESKESAGVVRGIEFR